MKLKNIKTQQEAVGFVIIILIVVIIGVIFLGISLRNRSEIVTIDSRIDQFLTASLRHTTPCYKDYDTNYKRVEDLIIYCYNSNSQSLTCPGGLDSCSYLNKTYNEMLSKFSGAGTLSYSGIKFFYRQNSSETLEDLKLRTSPFYSVNIGTTNGCSSKRYGTSVISASPGDVVIEMQVCPVLDA